MWSIFSLALVVLMLLLSLRFYLLHCLPPSGGLGTGLSSVSRSQKKLSNGLADSGKTMQPDLSSSKTDLALIPSITTRNQTMNDSELS